MCSLVDRCVYITKQLLKKVYLQVILSRLVVIPFSTQQRAEESRFIALALAYGMDDLIPAGPNEYDE